MATIKVAAWEEEEEENVHVPETETLLNTVNYLFAAVIDGVWE